MCKWGTRKKVKLMKIDFGRFNNEQYKIYLKKMGLREGEELIDSCIAPLVQALNDGRIKTTASCCGHGKDYPYVICEQGTEQKLKNFGCEIVRTLHDGLVCADFRVQSLTGKVYEEGR